MKRWSRLVMIGWAAVVSLVLGAASAGGALQAGTGERATAKAEAGGGSLHLPLVFNRFPGMNPWGFESNGAMMPGSVLMQRGAGLSPGWARLNGRISWKALQPVENGPVDWAALAGFEDELRGLRAAGIQAVVIVDDYPHWAVIPSRVSGSRTLKPTSCGPLKPEYYDDFARFMRALVRRYKAPEFNVHHWELGNEVDVDPSLVVQDSVFGCWGDIGDRAYYGGRRYGEMLKATAPEIRAEDPAAQIWMGGLLLATPNTQDDTLGKPENFLRGVLAAGGGEHFDVLPYHWYPTFWQAKLDYDFDLQVAAWGAYGGGVIGKAAFLRQILREYGVSKPLALNETALTCPSETQYHREHYPWCIADGGNPDEVFFEASADFLVRSVVRAQSADVQSYFWYTLDGPGWRQSGLLDGDGGTRRAGYYAYAQLGERLARARYLGPVDYGAAVEAHAFQQDGRLVQAVWAKTDSGASVSVPAAKFVGAWDRDGEELATTLSGASVVVPVGVSPVWLAREW